MKKIKILYITRAHNPNQGGMERLSYEFVEALKKDNRVLIHSISYRGNRKISPLFNLLAPFLTLPHVRNYDLIHLGDPLLSFTGSVLKLIFNKPVCVTVHGLDITFDNYFYKLYLGLFFKNFDAYLPISNFANTILKKYELKNPRLVINPGFKDVFYDPSISKTDLSKITNTPPDTHVFFTNGRLVRRKGHYWFIKNVFSQLPQNLIYIITGQGPELNRIKKLIRSLNFSNRIHLLGHVDKKTLKILYNGADAFIQPNIRIKNDPEGFGLVILEASSCNLPVFASRLDGIPDALHHNKNGFLLPALNSNEWIVALKKFINNELPPIYPRHYILDNYAWPNRITNYVNAYTHILSRQTIT